jgi:hypothetical protein
MATLSFTFIVDNVSHTTSIGTRRNIKKAVLFTRYQGIVNSSEAVCAYVGTKEINPASNLKIVHLEDSIPENSRTVITGDSQFASTSYSFASKYFTLTDVFGDYVSDELTPLYWKHILPDPAIDPDSVRILDSELNEVDVNSFEVVRINEYDATELPIDGSYEECAVYSNYLNSYNEETGDVVLYFVRYEAIGETHYEVLNQVPAYTEATFDDVSTITSDLKYWRKVYTISPGLTYYTITTPTVSTYSIRPMETGRIVLREPIQSDDTIPWFVNISNGAFSALRDGTSFSYSVPEYSNQDFSPIEPYKASIDEEAVYIRSDVIKVANGDLEIDSTFFVMNIIIKDYLGKTLYALTTDTSADGETYYEGNDTVIRNISGQEELVLWDGYGISSWDTNTGFIHFKREYPDTYTFLVSYYYKETGYLYSSLNLNPIFDEEYQGHSYVIYIVPTGGSNGNTGTQSSSIQWIKVDRSGRITDTSQDAATGNVDLKSEINTDGEYAFYSKSATTTAAGGITGNPVGQDHLVVADTTGFPENGIVTWTDLSGTERIVGFNSITTTRINFTSYNLLAGIFPGTDIYLYSFKDRFSSDTSNDYQWFILGEAYARPSSRIEELSLIDLRLHGGVIKESKYLEASKIDPRAVWARPETISTRGQVIPGDSVAVVKIPFTLLTDYGGEFTEQAILEIVEKRHLATGVIPVIIYHGAIPEIESISSTSSSITICWASEGTEYSYNVYKSSMKTGPWTKDNTEAIAGTAYGNCYTLTGLIPGLVYYVCVTSISATDVESPKSVVWGARTRLS